MSPGDTTTNKGLTQRTTSQNNHYWGHIVRPVRNWIYRATGEAYDEELVSAYLKGIPSDIQHLPLICAAIYLGEQRPIPEDPPHHLSSADLSSREMEYFFLLIESHFWHSFSLVFDSTP